MAARFYIPALVLALALGGCVLPNRLADKAPFREDVTGFIEPGVTSGNEIERQMGARYLESPDGQWWVFSADRRMTEWFWMFCTPGGCGGDVFGGDVHRYSLILEFDSNQIVKRSVVVTDQSPCVDDQSICFEDGELKVVEDENVLQLALEYKNPNAQCALLLRNNGYAEHGLLDELSASPDVDCFPSLTMRDDRVYTLGATEPYTGRLIVRGIDGVMKLERFYENGMLNGVETGWSEHGSKLYEANYQDNLLHGPVTHWNADGTVILSSCFENGLVSHRNADDCRSR